MAITYKIKDFLKRIKDTIEIEDGVSYKRVTVSCNHKGVSLRDEVDGSKIGTKKQFKIKGGDFILSKIDARNGAFGIIPHNLDNAIITGNFWTYEVDEKLVDTQWFFYFTHSFNFIQICIESSTGSTHRKYLDEKVFLNHNIVLPTKEEQKKMVAKYKKESILSENINTEIQNQKQLISQLKQSILQEAIQGKLTQEWREQNTNIEPASELLKRIKAEKEKLIKEKKIRKEKPLPSITNKEIPFEIPENWEWCRLGEITNYGSSEKIESKDIDENTWILDLEDIEKISSKLLQKKKFKERPSLSTKSVFKKGWILYSKLRPYLDKVIVADENGVCTTEILPLVVFSDLAAKFMMYGMKSKHFLNYVNSKVSGMKMPRLKTPDGKLALIPIAPVAEQKAIVEKVESLMEKCNALEQEVLKSEKHANMLMQAVLKEAFENKAEQGETKM